ncbi:PrgI family protein [Candidatus Parcubacteria bacterium]|nr:MAG: PrgI family protein [Candidatus Parcubacteria bacterium]
MQFQIPQFIEVEDKIFGPLTFRQFVYIVGGLGSSYLLYRVLPLFIALPIIAALLGLSAALAFFKYNGRPFILALEHGFTFFIHPRLYLWNNERKRQTVTAKQTDTPSEKGEVYVPKLSESKLHELAWSLDIKERIAAGIGSDEDLEQTGGVMPPRDAMSPVMTMQDVARRRE